ncbi:histidine kinase [Prevotella sp. 20925_1_30]|uniref:sensor histidine kinase n=1 Tax=Prevotella sp. 20925_1_30 TaxID=3003679 RepID=UPI00352D54EE
MRKQIYTSKVFWSQIVLWLPLFLVPIIYSPFGLFSWQESLYQYIVPLSMMIVAYVNYFVFAPKLLKGDEREFWIYNVILILFLSIAQHEWLYYTGTERYIISFSYQLLLQSEEENINPHLFFITRNIFNLSICAGAATSVLMAQRWSKAEEEKREAETAMTKAELINLRQQVNPHFLLNTMNNIYALTAFDTEKAQKAIIDLSKMLRHILYDYQQPYVSLKEEVEFLNNYIELMMIRLPDNVDIKRECNLPEPCNIQVAPMIFISLLENAFKHGISPSHKNFIHILLDANDERIVFAIENSHHPKTKEERSGHGIGLKQVERRLELAYPGKYQWKKKYDSKMNIYSSKIIIYDTKLYNH